MMLQIRGAFSNAAEPSDLEVHVVHRDFANQPTGSLPPSRRPLAFLMGRSARWGCMGAAYRKPYVTFGKEL